MYTQALAAVAAVLMTTNATPIPRQTAGKRGICYNQPSTSGLFVPSASWAYNWATSSNFAFPEASLAQGLEYVPMYNPKESASWQPDIENALNAGAKNILGFNEPDRSDADGGTDMPDAAAAAELYINNIVPYKGRARLGAPAVSAGGIEWLRTFVSACAGRCQIDFVPLHFYDYDHPEASVQFASLQGWLESTIPDIRNNMFQNPSMEIWLTEFAATPFTDQAKGTEYMNLALPYLDSNPDITRYSYFKADETILVNGGQLSDAGRTYTGQ